MKLIKISALIIPIIIFSISKGSTGLSAETLVLDDKQVYEYATQLYREGEYYRAVTEYHRFLYFFPESPKQKEARLQIGRSYMAGGQLDEAIRFWKNELSEMETDHESYAKIKILLGISLLDLDQTAIFSFREHNVEEAMEHFAELDSKVHEREIIGDFSREWQLTDFAEDKSPVLAGSLSAVLPGAGSFYTGRYLEGIYAFFITGLFYLATVEAIGQEHEEAGFVFGFLTLGFYGGNIYAAINGAHKTNDALRSDTLMRLRQKHGIWFIPASDRHPGRF